MGSPCLQPQADLPLGQHPEKCFLDSRVPAKRPLQLEALLVSSAAFAPRRLLLPPLRTPGRGVSHCTGASTGCLLWSLKLAMTLPLLLSFLLPFAVGGSRGAWSFRRRAARRAATSSASTITAGECAACQACLLAAWPVRIPVLVLLLDALDSASCSVCCNLPGCRAVINWRMQPTANPGEVSMREHAAPLVPEQRGARPPRGLSVLLTRFMHARSLMS